MSGRPYYPAPWERALSRIPRDDHAAAAPANAPEEPAPGTDGPAVASVPGGRRRLDDDGGSHPRLSVAELIARIGHPGNAPIADAADERDEASGNGDTTDDDPAAGERADESPPGESAVDEATSSGSTITGGDDPDAGEPPRPPQPSGESGDGRGPGSPAPGAAGEPVGSPRSAPASVPGREAEAHAHSGGWLRATHILVALVSVFALVGTGIVWGYLHVTDGQYTRVSALDRGSPDVRDPAGQTGDENYLIVGTDSRAGANSDVGAGSAQQVEGARSDTIILVNIPASRKRVVAVSFPRDLNIDRPSCARWDNGAAQYLPERAPAADDVKLNSAYSFGGPRCLVTVIQKLSGLRIDHFIGMDFAGFESMVDTVGGVEVCTKVPLVDDELGVILPHPGTQEISGETALKYVRARKVEAEGNGDYGRIVRQQKFLSSLLRKALSNQVLLDPSKLNTFINEFTQASFGDNLDTRALITLGRSLQDVDADQVTFLTVPTDGTDAWGNETPRTTDIRNIFDAIIDDDPLPGESPEDGDDAAAGASAGASDAQAGAVPPGQSADPHDDQVHAVAPGTVSVQVTNASHSSGFATSVARQLGAHGFAIYDLGNHLPIDSGTIVQFSGDNRAAAATVASAVPGARLQRTSGLGDIVEVLLTDDSQAMMTAPAAVGTVIDAPLASDSNTPGSVPLDVSVVNAGDTSCG